MNLGRMIRPQNNIHPPFKCLQIRIAADDCVYTFPPSIKMTELGEVGLILNRGSSCIAVSPCRGVNFNFLFPSLFIAEFT